MRQSEMSVSVWYLSEIIESIDFFKRLLKSGLYLSDILDTWILTVFLIISELI